MEKDCWSSPSPWVIVKAEEVSVSFRVAFPLFPVQDSATAVCRTMTEYSPI